MSIRSEVEKRLLTWAKAQVPPVPVSVENVPFTKPTAGGYLKIFFLDAATVNSDVAAKGERETGVFQVDVCVPEGTGVLARDALVASVKALFPVLPKTGTVSIERPPHKSMGSNRIDGFSVVYLSFSYRQER
jgi:hypothetical protein